MQRNEGVDIFKGFQKSSYLWVGTVCSPTVVQEELPLFRIGCCSVLVLCIGNA